jgi:hypothetical protein
MLILRGFVLFRFAHRQANTVRVGHIDRLSRGWPEDLFDFLTSDHPYERMVLASYWA